MVINADAFAAPAAVSAGWLLFYYALAARVGSAQLSGANDEFFNMANRVHQNTNV